MAKKFKWRAFFSDFRGNRMNQGDGEEQRYQAFKARFLEEQKQAEITGQRIAFACLLQSEGEAYEGPSSHSDISRQS